MIKLLLRIVIYEIILECIQEKNHLQAADVANLLYRNMAGKNVNVQGGKSCADRFAMLIFSKGKKISRNILF